MFLTISCIFVSQEIQGAIDLTYQNSVSAKGGEQPLDIYVDSDFYFDFAHQQTRGTPDLDGIVPQFKSAERVHKIK